MSGCLFCACEALAACRPPPYEPGSSVPVICGRCGGIQLVDIDTADGLGGTLRHAAPAEALELRRDPDVARWLRAYEVALIEDRMPTKRK